MMQHAASSDRPRFRHDHLVAESVEEQGAKFVDVMDPDSGTLFRFYEVEFSIACAMDGERDVAGLVKWAQDELGVSPSATEVRSVIATLGELGYLDGERPVGDVPLAAGVVVGPQPAVAAASDVALGRAGTTARPAGAMPKAPELDLGAPGAGPAMRARPPVEDIALGAPGRAAEPASAKGPTSDVSLDLSDHIAVKPADVKEAVRQSKVMAAVDVPKDLLEPEPPRPMPMPPAPRPTPMPPVPKPAAIAPTPIAPTPVAQAPLRSKPASKPPVELPQVPEKHAIVPPAPRRSYTTVLVVLLILVIAGGAGFAVWKLILDRTNASDQSTSDKVQPGPAPAPAPAPAPVVEPQKPRAKGKISMQPPAPKTILSMFGGVVEWVEGKEKPVKSGDVVMRLVGYKQLDATIATLQKDVDKRLNDVDAIRKTRDAAAAAGEAAAQKAQEAKLADREAALNKRQDLLTSKKDQIEQFVVRVNLDGTFSPTAKVGQRIPENTPVATIAPDPQPAVTFEVPEGTKLEFGTAVALEIVGAPKGARPITCTAAEWSPRAQRIVCPVLPELPEGTEVSWELP